MKRIIVLLAMPLLVMGCGKTENYSIYELKADKDSRYELFSSIINDRELLAEFLSQLTIHENGMDLLIMNDEAMRYFFDMDNMYLMAQTKPEIMLMMVNNLAHITKNDTSVRIMMMNLPPMQQFMRDQELARK